MKANVMAAMMKKKKAAERQRSAFVWRENQVLPYIANCSVIGIGTNYERR